jgi:hypothetical protein
MLTIGVGVYQQRGARPQAQTRSPAKIIYQEMVG